MIIINDISFVAHIVNSQNYKYTIQHEEPSIIYVPKVIEVVVGTLDCELLDFLIDELQHP